VIDLPDVGEERERPDDPLESSSGYGGEYLPCASPLTPLESGICETRNGTSRAVKTFIFFKLADIPGTELRKPSAHERGLVVMKNFSPFEYWEAAIQ